MGAINAMEPYQHDMGLSGAGSSSGIVFIVYNLGQIAAFPFCGLLADGWGRRICIFVGCFLVIVGTAIQGSAHGLQQFIGGRFVLGFGASIASAAGPAYTVEASTFFPPEFSISLTIAMTFEPSKTRLLEDSIC